jgi:hypothetical protein
MQINAGKMSEEGGEGRFGGSHGAGFPHFPADAWQAVRQPAL